ncbi:hypothetical protein RSOL_248600 [Rhizoctonia solani AG-3 Rhs1AP]|uniref:Transmembrane protein n=2 Tax=Rhizoctonia solani AG-3 TaxID=1086053 RepID=A0A074SN15_9AGAM|nr:hypothetical protein RSOL_248600 [Rhizoctonia solani AG-3 Rhs1AP]KEP51437.1 hypothetical protein V565_061660 [Rhizoctonia solani 123E]
MSRLLTLAFMILSLGLLVQASPRMLPATIHVSGVSTLKNETSPGCIGDTCFGGLELVPIMEKLQNAVEIRLKSLDQSLETNGANYVDILNSIENLICDAIGAIQVCKLSWKDHLSGKLLKAVKIWHNIVMAIAMNLGKWVGRAEFRTMEGPIQKIHIALENCQVAITKLGGVFGGVVGFGANLFTKAEFGILHAVNLNSTAATLKQTQGK